MALEGSDGTVRIGSDVLHKLMHLAGELLVARDQFQAVRARAGIGATPEPPPVAATPVRSTLALFSTPDEGRMAIPLSQVDRIEEFDAVAVFQHGGQSVVRYRGRLLPLIEVSNVLPERRHRPRRGSISVPFGNRERVQVVVHTAGDRMVGLLVDRLLDVFEDTLVQEQPGSRAGARASVVLRGRVTELVDVDEMYEAVTRGFWNEASAPDGSH